MITKVQGLIKEAMKSKNALELTTYRAVLVALTAKDDNGNIPTEDRQVPILRKMVTARREVSVTYKEQGRQNLADAETREADLIEKLLPAELSEADAILFIGEQFNASQHPKDKKHMGKIIAEIGAKANGTINGKLIASTVLAKINNR